MPEITNTPRYDITLYRGDDYYDTDGRAVSYEFASPPSLSGATVKLKAIDLVAEITGSVSGQIVKFDIPRATTSTWAVGKYTYEVEATLSNTHVITLAVGILTVK